MALSRRWRLPLLMSALGHAQKGRAPLGKPLISICSCVCLYFCLLHFLTLVHLPIPRSCALAISSHLRAQRGYDESYLYVGEMDRPCPRELNELRQSREASTQTVPTPQPSEHHPLPLLSWANSPGGALCKTTVVISIDRSSSDFLLYRDCPTMLLIQGVSHRTDNLLPLQNSS